MRAFSPGEEVRIALFFVSFVDEEIEFHEAVFAREGSDELVFLGDARRGASSSEASRGGSTTRYTASLEARIGRGATPGEYRCVRLSARDRFDDDWNFSGSAGLDLVVRVERAPHCLEVTASDFL